MESFGPNGQKIGNVVREKLFPIWSSRFWTPLLFWQPVTPTLFAALALTSVGRCIGPFLKWIFNMASIKERYIYMPLDDATYRKVVGEYTARGFPGCVGSVDCVHIGLDRCPVQYTNMYNGKEGYR